MKGYSLASQNRFVYDNIPASLRNLGLAPFNYVGWGPRREMPIFAKQSFSKQYRKNNK